MFVIEYLVNGKSKGYLCNRMYFESNEDNAKKPILFDDVDEAYDVIIAILERTDMDDAYVEYNIIEMKLNPVKIYKPEFHWSTPKEDRKYTIKKLSFKDDNSDRKINIKSL